MPIKNMSFAMTVLMVTAPLHATVYYHVTRTGTGSGADWNSPCSLQYALANCGNSDVIRVKGDSLPYVPGTSRTDTFLLPDGCDLYGGFTGSTTNPGERAVPTCTDGDSSDKVDYTGKPCKEVSDCGTSGTCNNTSNKTILSGEIGTSALSDNSYHVLTYALSTDPDNYDEVIDGFIIEGGYADGTGVNQNQGSALHIRKNALCVGGSNNGNTCTAAGDCPGGNCQSGVCSVGGPTVSNCLIQDNHSADHGAVNDHASGSSYENCQFRDNGAAHGAALQIDNGSPTVSNSLFVGNDTNGTPHEGGAVWAGCRSDTSGCPSTCQASIEDSTFYQNSANYVAGNTAQGFGGAIWMGPTFGPTSDNTVGTTTHVADCLFLDNAAGNSGAGSRQGFGGAVFATLSAPTIEGCVFDSNTVRDASGVGSGGGGGIWVEQTTGTTMATVTDCVFKNNTVSGSDYAAGGGIYSDDANLYVESSQFLGNRTLEAGGGALHLGNGDVVYANCQFIGNISFVSTEAGGGAGFAVYSGTGCIEFINTSFVSNHYGGESSGAAGVNVSSTYTGSVEAVNCIFWGNYEGGATPSESSQFNSAYMSASYSIIQGFSGSTNNNTGSDPDFMRDPADCDSDDWGDPPCTTGCSSGCDDYGYLYTRPYSPAHDAGDNSVLAATVCPDITIDVDFDIVDRTRSVDGDDANSTVTVDMGAYEWSGECHSWDDCDILHPESGYMCCNNVCDGTCCTDGNCSSPVPYCRTTGTNTCVQCLTNAQCGAGNLCCDNICRSGWSCCSNSDCKNGKVCCETTHTCVLPANCGY